MLFIELLFQSQSAWVFGSNVAVMRPAADKCTEEGAAGFRADHRPRIPDSGVAQRLGHDVVERTEEKDRIEGSALVPQLGNGRERSSVPLKNAWGARGCGEGSGSGAREVEETLREIDQGCGVAACSKGECVRT